jgi:hypothetical protein
MSWTAEEEQMKRPLAVGSEDLEKPACCVNIDITKSGIRHSE